MALSLGAAVSNDGVLDAVTEDETEVGVRSGTRVFITAFLSLGSSLIF